MLAAQITKPGHIEFSEVDAPEPAEGEIAVAPLAITLCGSDHPDFIPEVKGTQYPRPVGRGGHEIVGTVVASRSAKHKEGDRVLALPVDQRGLVERFVCAAEAAVPVPDTKPAEELAIAQPLSTLVKVWPRIPKAAEKTVAIVGQGGIGLLYTAMFRHHGAATIIALDLHDLRLEVARKTGADATVNCSREEPEAAIRELTGGRMADLVIEAVGQPDAVNTAIHVAGANATLVPFGVPREHQFVIDFVQLLRKQMTVVFSGGTDPATHFAPAVELIAGGAIDVSPMISHRLRWTELQAAFELVTGRKAECVKVVLIADEANAAGPPAESTGEVIVPAMTV